MGGPHPTMEGSPKESSEHQPLLVAEKTYISPCLKGLMLLRATHLTYTHSLRPLKYQAQGLQIWLLPSGVKEGKKYLLKTSCVPSTSVRWFILYSFIHLSIYTFINIYFKVYWLPAGTGDAKMNKMVTSLK